jgi:hypothetical protein
MPCTLESVKTERTVGTVSALHQGMAPEGNETFLFRSLESLRQCGLHRTNTGTFMTQKRGRFGPERACLCAAGPLGSSGETDPVRRGVGLSQLSPTVSSKGRARNSPTGSRSEGIGDFSIDHGTLILVSPRPNRRIDESTRRA